MSLEWMILLIFACTCSYTYTNILIHTCMHVHVHHTTCIYILYSDNLLVTQDWTIKVADFGLTRFISEKKAMTQVGTPMWMVRIKFDVIAYHVHVDDLFVYVDDLVTMHRHHIVCTTRIIA